MEIIKTKLEDAVIILPKVFGDKRGSFHDTFNRKDYEDHNLPTDFVQISQSKSKRGILRGLHFQKNLAAQGKLVRVPYGSVLDVFVDLRERSSSFKKWDSIYLSGKNNKILWIPKGFAHGFLALEDNTIMNYSFDNFYNPNEESGVIWNDPDLNIDWQLEKYKIKTPSINKKDKILPKLQDSEYSSMIN